MDVPACVVTNVSQGGETKVCWDRMECHGYPSGVTYSPINNTFSSGAPTPSGGNSTIASIEEEAKKRFCSEKIADIPRVVAQCKTDAHSDYSYNLGAVCQGQTSKTITGSISAWIFGGTRSTTTSCTLLERAKRDAAISKCDSDAENVRRALDKQCKG